MAPNEQGEYDQYNHQMQGLAGHYQPWVNQGWKNNQQFSQHNMNDANNPTYEMNKIAGTWQASPFQQNMMHGVSGMMNNNAAQTGMLGSTSANSQLQGDLTNMVGQYQHQYVQDGMDQYNNAIRNQGYLGQQGLNALGQQSQLSQEGYLGGLEGARANDQWHNNLYSDALGGAMAGYKGML